jgi:predicted transcriptional regulator
LEYWVNESQKKLVYDKIKAAIAARMGVATDEGFQKMIRDYESQVAAIDRAFAEATGGTVVPVRKITSWLDVIGQRKG